MSNARRSTCPMACALDLVGDRWTLLVLRDLFAGKHHYDEFAESDEQIASNVLSERLRRLQHLGMVSVETCADNRRRKRYELTERGRSFAPVLAALGRWGLEHIAGTIPAPHILGALSAELARQRARAPTKRAKTRP